MTTDGMISHREKAFGKSVESGLREYNLSDVDWLFSIGLPRIKTAAIMGSKIRAGSLYIASQCEKLVVISGSEEQMDRLRAVAAEEGLKNIDFGKAGAGLYDSLKGSVDYFAVFEELSGSDSRIEMLSLASKIVSGNGAVAFSLSGSRAGRCQKRELAGFGFGYSEAYWALPSLARPTWSGKLNAAGSYRTWIEALDFYNVPSSMPVFARRAVVSRAGKAILKAMCRALYPFRKYIFKDIFVVAARQKTDLAGRISHLLQEPSVRKSKASKEGRVIFFGMENGAGARNVLYASRLKEYEHLLKNELMRNVYSRGTIRAIPQDGGPTVLSSDYVSGDRIDIRGNMDAGAVSWLTDFHVKTFSGHWEDGDYLRFISARTFGSAAGPAGRLLDLCARENRRISVVAEHGDYNYLNILKSREGRCVLDWEYYNGKGDEFFDMAFFLLDMYTEEPAGGKIKLAEFFRTAPARYYLDSFMKKKNISNSDIMLLAVALAAVRVKHQSLFYASVKDSRYWMYDSVISGLLREVAAI